MPVGISGSNNGHVSDIEIEYLDFTFEFEKKWI